MNVIAISGNIVRDIELKTTPDGVSVCAFTVAVRRPNTKEKTDFITCVAWRQKAEFISRYFTKGQKIEVAGCLTSRKWEDKNGGKRTAFEIIVDDVSFGESKKAEAGAANNTPQEYPPEDFEEIANDEDLPF